MTVKRRDNLMISVNTDNILILPIYFHNINKCSNIKCVNVKLYTFYLHICLDYWNRNIIKLFYFLYIYSGNSRIVPSTKYMVWMAIKHKPGNLLQQKQKVIASTNMHGDISRESLLHYILLYYILLTNTAYGNYCK